MATAPFAIETKRAAEIISFTLDWDDNVLTDSGQIISTSAWTIPSGITKDSDAKDNSTTTIVMSGGTDNSEYDLVNLITDNGGLKFERTLRIIVALLPTDDEVLSLVDSALTDMQPFIIPAYVLVKKLIDTSKADALQRKEIMRWLAAHFLAMREDGARLQAEVIGETSERFSDSGLLDKYLDMTRYGQMAQVLDTTGVLHSAGKPRAQFSLI